MLNFIYTGTITTQQLIARLSDAITASQAALDQSRAQRLERYAYFLYYLLSIALAILKPYYHYIREQSMQLRREQDREFQETLEADRRRVCS